MKALLILFSILCANAQALDLFGKGSISKNFLDTDKYTISLSMSGGLAFSLLPFIRLEARYVDTTALQNKMDVVSGSVLGTLTDIKTQTRIVSVGLDLSFTSDKSPIQPFIYAGVGYLETERSYYFTLSGASSSSYYTEPKKMGISLNGGLGLRLRLSRSIALELEAFGYLQDAQLPNPLLNVYGTAGLRIGI